MKRLFAAICILGTSIPAVLHAANDAVQAQLDSMYEKSGQDAAKIIAARSLREQEKRRFASLRPVATGPVLEQQIVTRKNEKRLMVVRAWYNLETSESKMLGYIVDLNMDAFSSADPFAVDLGDALMQGMIATHQASYWFNKETKKWDGMYVPDLFAANQILVPQMFHVNSLVVIT